MKVLMKTFPAPPPPPSLAVAYPENFEIYRLENVISSVNHSEHEIDSNMRKLKDFKWIF